MQHPRILPLTLLAAALVGACASAPERNVQLEQARSDYLAVQNGGNAATLAPVELKQAGDALGDADAAAARHAPLAEVDHLAYIASQRTAIARETASKKSAEAAIADAGHTRDQVRLAARTQEADAAQRSADASKRSADAARGQTDAARRETDAAVLQAGMAQQQASDTQMRNNQLEAQLKDMNAQKTERGLVITIGDVLFDTDRAELKSGGMRSVDKLVGFLKQHPQRSARVEGFTDSTGSESHNMALSSHRADAVRLALVDMGIERARIETQGYGEAFPVAGNDSASGRQLNRRVEIIVSEDGGAVAPR